MKKSILTITYVISFVISGALSAGEAEHMRQAAWRDGERALEATQLMVRADLDERLARAGYLAAAQDTAAEAPNPRAFLASHGVPADQPCALSTADQNRRVD